MGAFVQHVPSPRFDRAFLSQSVRWLRGAQEQGAIKVLLGAVDQCLAADPCESQGPLRADARRIAAPLSDDAAPAEPEILGEVATLIARLEEHLRR